MKLAIFTFGLILLGELATAMDFETVKMRVWARGEEIGGEEFVAANEQVVDYLAALERPAGGWDTIKYSCQIKARTIRPTVQQSGTSPQYNYVWVQTVYDIKDCEKAAD